MINLYLKYTLLLVLGVWADGGLEDTVNGEGFGGGVLVVGKKT